MVPGTPDAAEFALNANHRSMTKFSNADDEESKQLLSRALELMIHKSGPKVEANWTLEGRMKQGNQQCCSAALCRLKIFLFYHGAQICLGFVTTAGFRYKILTCTCSHSSPLVIITISLISRQPISVLDTFNKSDSLCQ